MCGKEDLIDIVVKHVDEKGQDLVPVYKAQGYSISEFENFDINAKEINGYELVSAPEKKSGWLGKGSKSYEFVFKYKKATAKPADKTALDKAIKEAKAIENNNYTDKSWAALQDAIVKAEAVFKNSKATQAEVNAQVTALEKAVEGLVQKDPEGPLENPDAGEELTPEFTDKIVDRIEKVEEGSEVTVEMNGATKVPTEILEAAAGKDVDVAFDMGAYTWTINGQNIKPENLQTINLEVEIGSNNIPQEVVDAVVGDNESVQISLAHVGEFGLEAELSFNVNAENADKNAVLYYYNSEGELEKVQSNIVGADGAVAFTFEHAADYLIVLEEKMAEVDKTALEKALADAEAIKKGNYTDESWNALQKAIETAKAALEDEKATQDEVDAQVEALTTAVKALKEKPEQGKPDPEDPNKPNQPSKPNKPNGDSGNTNGTQKPNKPDAGKGDTPKTGDTAQPFVYVMGMLVAVGTCVLIFKRKKTH